MFFSKTQHQATRRSGSQSLLGGLATRPAAARPTGQLLVGGGSGGTAVQEPRQQPVLEPEVLDMKDVPEGPYVRFEDIGIPLSFEDCFVGIGTGRNVEGMQEMRLLVASEAYARHAQFELDGRLRKAGYRTTQIRRATREIVRSVHARNKRQDDAASHASETENAWRDLVNSAIKKGASDIHIETRGDYAQVLFRIYGERVEQPTISMATATAVCNTMYGFHADTNSKETAWDPDSVKECSIEHTTPEGLKAQLRFESTPIHPATAKNFQAVIRVLLMESSSKRIEDIGYTDTHISVVEQMLVGAQGMVLLVGPTNSGKSTSMQAFMQKIFEVRGRNIKAVTVEDPVEYLIDGACQMGVPKGRKALESRDGSIFRTFLKATLRLDPDVVLVGEIRDSESAEATKDLVLAGRKLLSTLHVYEAFAAFERLKELGVPPSVLYMEGFISGVIYQRLVPTLCDKCSIPFREAVIEGLIRPALAERVARVSDLEQDNVRIRRRGGCEHCNFSGITGRTTCAELLVPDGTFLSLLRTGNEAKAREYWHNNQELAMGDLGVTAVAHAILKMREGLLDPADIEAQIGLLNVRHPSSAAPYAGAAAAPAPTDRFAAGPMDGSERSGLRD